MALEFTKDDPYVHSNYYLFSKQLRDYFFEVDEQKGINLMQQKITELKKVRDQLRDKALEFLDGDTPEMAWRSIQQNDPAMSKIGKQVVANPRAKQALQSYLYDKESAFKTVKTESELAKHLANNISEIIDIQDLTKEITTFLFDKGFGGKTKIQQIEELSKTFNISQKQLDEIIDKFLKGKLRSVNGKIQKIVKEILVQQNINSKNSGLAYSSFISYFEREVREKAKAGGMYSVNESIVERYLDKTRERLKEAINKSQYSNTDSSRALGEEIICSVNDNKLMVMVPGGTKLEKDFRAELLPTLEQATTFTGLNKMSYSDMVLINKNGMRVRAQSKNYVGAYDTFLKFGGVEQHTNLYSKEMLFKEFFEKLQQSNNFMGSLDLNYLSYIVANEVWFDSHGSISGRGSEKGFRGNNTHTRLFESDSWLTRAMSGALINFLGVVVSSETVLTDVSNIFFLIDNKALIPTYELINNILDFWDKGVKQMTNIKVSANLRGVKYKYDSPLGFLKEKADAAGGLGPATYEDQQLVNVGKEQGRKIMETLKFKGVRIDVDLNNLLTSAWRFQI